MARAARVALAALWHASTVHALCAEVSAAPVGPVVGSRSISPLYCLNVRLAVKPDRRDEFLECIEANQRGTWGEPLAVTYVFGEDEDSPNVFHFHERYQGKEGFEAHTLTDHFADWKEFEGSEPLTEPPKVEFFTESIADSDTSRGSNYCLNGRLVVKPDRRDDFLECASKQQLAVLSDEPASVTFRYGEDEEDPNVFHLHERYLGKEGYEAHLATDHYADWKAFEATDPFAEPAQLDFWQEGGVGKFGEPPKEDPEEEW